SSTNATSCTAGGSWSGAKATSGSGWTGTLYSSTTYTITCTGAGGTSPQASATVTVTSNPPSVTLYADPAGPVAYNSQFALWWSTANVTSCTANNVDVSWTGNKTTAGGGQMVVATATKTYAIDCTGPNGPAHAEVTVTVTGVPVPAPTASISVSPTSVTSGGTSTITWSSTNATSCTAGGSWSGAKATSGSGWTPALYADTTYSLYCTGAGGTSATQYATVTVGVATPAPTVSISASPTSVTSGGSSTLSWSTTNATSCTASNGWTGAKATSGSALTGGLYSSTTYTLLCVGPGGNANASTTVTVTAIPAVNITLSATPDTVEYGEASEIYWYVTGANYCTNANNPGDSNWSGSFNQPSGYKITSALTAPTTYSLYCSNSMGGSQTASVTVSVNGAVPVRKPIFIEF
ncbi:hypothetical protein K2Q02_00555, partial [Patescibacteria group bacterium]|nr:hypothetical protein [Patescibacteria group bacterium]